MPTKNDEKNKCSVCGNINEGRMFTAVYVGMHWILMRILKRKR